MRFHIDIVMHSDFKNTNSNYLLVRYLQRCYMHISFRLIFCNKVLKFFQCHYVGKNSVKLNKVLSKKYSQCKWPMIPYITLCTEIVAVFFPTSCLSYETSQGAWNIVKVDSLNSYIFNLQNNFVIYNMF